MLGEARRRAYVCGVRAVFADAGAKTWVKGRRAHRRGKRATAKSSGRKRNPTGAQEGTMCSRVKIDGIERAA